MRYRYVSVAFFVASVSEIATDNLSQQLKRRYIEYAHTLMQNQPEKQLDTRMVQLKKDASDQLKELDYSTRLETAEDFTDEVEVVSPKQVINLVNSAKPGSGISITGPRGIGKSVFIQRMSYLWALGYGLNRYKLFFWIDLSTMLHGQHCSLSQLLSACARLLGFTNRVDIDSSTIVVLDNYSESYRNVLLEILFRQCTAVVTTSCTVKNIRCNIHLHMLGLTDRQIFKQALHHYCDDCSRAEEFLQYLSTVPNFSILKRVPLYLFGLLSVFYFIPTAHLPQTLIAFLSCLALLMAGLSHDELNHTVEQLTLSSVLVAIGNLPPASKYRLQSFCQIAYVHSKPVLHGVEVSTWLSTNPSLLEPVLVALPLTPGDWWTSTWLSANFSFLRSVPVALPHAPGEWWQITRYPLLKDFLASIHLCSAQEPVDWKSQVMLCKELQYFCFKLMPNIQSEFEKQVYAMALMMYSYEDDDTPEGSYGSIDVSDMAISGWTIYHLTSVARNLVFANCDFTPAAAAVLCNSIGGGSSVHMTASENMVEYTR